jgi:hypothetical protein
LAYDCAGTRAHPRSECTGCSDVKVLIDLTVAVVVQPITNLVRRQPKDGVADPPVAVTNKHSISLAHTLTHATHGTIKTLFVVTGFADTGGVVGRCL